MIFVDLLSCHFSSTWPQGYGIHYPHWFSLALKCSELEHAYYLYSCPVYLLDCFKLQYFKKILRPSFVLPLCAFRVFLIKSFLLKFIEYVFWRCVAFSNQFRAVFADLKSSLLAFLQPIIGNWEVTTIHCNVHVIDVKLGRFFPTIGFYCTWF